MPVTAKGLEGIVANSTRLSDVIGDKGQLIYNGYDINELVGKVDYKEVVYLLWKGKLPNRTELADFVHKLRAERELPVGVINFIKSAPKDANPMGCYFILTINPNSDKQRENSLNVEFVRFEYDVEKAAMAVENSPLPNAYAESLRRGM